MEFHNSLLEPLLHHRRTIRATFCTFLQGSLIEEDEDCLFLDIELQQIPIPYVLLSYKN